MVKQHTCTHSYDSSCSDNTLVDDESSPFLDGDLEGAIKLETRPSGASGLTKRATATPIPKAQLAVLCIVRLVDPIAFTQIFPYVNEMIEYLHVTEDASKIGFYSGLVESCFAVCQMLAIYQWARLSDRVGRKPVVLVGVAGIALGTLLMGFSQSFGAMMFARGLAGFFCGNIAVVHSVLAELTDSSNQALAFSIYGLCWPLGAVLGPLLGGAFSSPATKYPSLFDYEIFRTYPYLLPSLVASAVAFSGSIFGIFFLEETLPAKRRQRPRDPAPQFTTPSPNEKSQTVGVKYLLSIPIIRALCLSGLSLAFIATAFDVIFVLFCYSSIENGGLAFTTEEIGMALATSGLVYGALQILIMPFLLKHFDHGKMYNTCMGIWPLTFVLLPGLYYIARIGATIVGAPGEEHLVVGPTTKAMLWLGIGVVLSIGRVASLAFGVSMILVKEAAPDSASLGATNGLIQFAMCFARSFSPAFSSTIYALSMRSSVSLMRYFWVAVMACIAFYGMNITKKIIESRKLLSITRVPA